MNFVKQFVEAIYHKVDYFSHPNVYDIVQNGSRVRVKPKNQPGRDVLAS